MSNAVTTIRIAIAATRIFVQRTSSPVFCSIFRRVSAGSVDIGADGAGLHGSEPLMGNERTPRPKKGFPRIRALPTGDHGSVSLPPPTL